MSDDLQTRTADPRLGDADPASGGAPWTDLQQFVALPRLTGLVTGPDGALLVSVSALDADGTGYRSSWWRVDPTGARTPRAYTRSVEGEGAAAFLPDGRLLFTSKRPVPSAGADSEHDEGDDRQAVWCLPPEGGEASVLASRSGGWDSITTARTSSRVVLGLPVLAGSADLPEDAAKRRLRRKHKISALLHEAAPVRYWDHDLGPDIPQLVAVDLDAPADPLVGAALANADLRLVLPTRGRSLDSTPHLTPEGDLAVVAWSTPAPRGVTRTSVALLDLDAAVEGRAVEVEILAAATDEYDFDTPVISPDGSVVVCVRNYLGTAEEPADQALYVIDRATGQGRLLAGEWDRWPTPAVFSADSSTVYVTADENGHAPVYAVEVATGQRRRLTDLGSHSSLCLSWDGTTLYALRSDYTDPGSVVAIDPRSGVVTVLPRPVSYPTLPGRMENVEVLADDGARVRGYLVTPTTAAKSSPAPLVLWVHGGPFSSWNSWSWRWCPWLLVAQGYAVLLPDPALSTGYGQTMIARGWTDWGDAPYTDLMTITDLVEQRPDIDASRTAVMGGSFGGYMANWIAGHTDRFRAVVTHASLWDLETFLRTTDAPWAWQAELTPEMRRRNSPARFADRISTPVLVVHGDKDYRVPISEGLALWWDLVSRFDGPPEDLPHKFLYFPDENHWVLSPQHSVVWYETVLAFLETHLGKGNFARPAAL
jgi:dipeptidyl aminopeptidase/acylaminoacyl peptidase